MGRIEIHEIYEKGLRLAACVLHFDNLLRLSVSAASDFTYKIYWVERVERKYSNWCWAATAEMIGKTLNAASSKTQTSAAAHAGITTNVTGTLAQQIKAANYVAQDPKTSSTDSQAVPMPWWSFTQTNRALTWSELYTQVYTNCRSVSCNIFANGSTSGAGHSICIFGLEQKDGVKYVYVYDPAAGYSGERIIAYNDLVNGGGTMSRIGRSNYKWLYSITGVYTSQG